MTPKKRCSKKKKIEEVILLKQRNNLMMKMTERQNVLMKKKTERQKRPWSDLPADILMEIMARNYSSTDQIRFRAVCKSWQQLPIDHDNPESAIDNINKLPWIVTGDWTDNDEDDDSINDTEMSCVLTCKLFDQTHSNPYSVNKILFRDRRSNERTRICCSKNGWLLFEKRKHINLTSFFLFSPFTQQFIDLPDLDNSIPCSISTSSHATFSSSDPYNDPNCKFFVLRDYSYRYSNRITVSTCRRGDQNWTTRVFDKTIEVFSTGPIKQVLYTELGYLCCLSDFGSLVAYSVTDEDWIQPINLQMHLIDGMFEGRPYLVECKEGLLLVLVRASHFYDAGCRIFKFSWLSNVYGWSVESSLPNQAIFVGPTSLLVPTSGDLANRIYYHELASGDLKFYCLKDRKSYKYLLVDDDFLHRGWLAKGNMQDGVWIQSPQLHTHC